VTPSEVWRLDGHQAHFSVGDLSAAVSLTQPGLGLHAIHWQGTSLVGAQLLAIRFAGDDESQEMVIADSFVRGRDLAVTYAQTPERPVRLQIYWRAMQHELAGKRALGWDVQVSVQTSLLAAHPALSIVSRAIGKAAWETGCAGDAASRQDLRDEAGRSADCYRFSFAGAFYFEMVHPADVEREHVSATAAGGELAHELFAQSLEKGVILRARARGLFMAAADSSLATAMYEQFLLAPPPLTT
jgi:hypothetical protein